MFRILIARLIDTIPTLLLVSLVVFILLELSPGDPALKVLASSGGDVVVDDRDLAALRHDLGLDQPPWERYALWMNEVIRLDLGESFVNKKPVGTLVLQKLPASLILAAVTLFASVAIAVPLGVVTALRANSTLDGTVRIVTLVGASFPSFWIALACMWLFAVQLHLLPALGGFTVRGIVLPALVLTIRTSALLVRVTRAAVLESLHADFIIVARAKGLSPFRVVWRHILPNAAIPILTVVGLDFAGLVAHAAVIEWIFAWPGIGRMGIEAALAGDTPALLGFVLVTSVIVLFVNLVVDVAYGLADPRIRTAVAK